MEIKERAACKVTEFIGLFYIEVVVQPIGNRVDELSR
jgi:hypothetical protein